MEIFRITSLVTQPVWARGKMPQICVWKAQFVAETNHCVVVGIAETLGSQREQVSVCFDVHHIFKTHDENRQQVSHRT